MVRTPTAAKIGATGREVVGAVLAPALFFRAAVHVLVAAANDIDPHLDDDSDVTLASPVPELRGDRDEILARLGSVALACFFAFEFGYVAGAGLAGTWLTINWVVLVGDPIAGVLAWILDRDQVQISYVNNFNRL